MFGFFVLIGLAILVTVMLIFWEKRRAIIIEGMIIGVISGVLISYITDANFQASINGPISSWCKKIYSSKDWTSIKVVRLNKELVEVKATNVVSGDVVTFQDTSLGKLPADLRWDIETRNKELKNKLRKLYGEISVLSDYPIPSGNSEALQEYETRVNKWASDTSMWIEKNLGFGAREIFLNRGEGGRIYSSDYDERFDQLMSDLKGYKEGLKELLESDEVWFEDKN